MPLPLAGDGGASRIVALDRTAGAYVVAVLVDHDGTATARTWASIDGFLWVEVRGAAFEEKELGNLAMAAGPAGLLLVGQKPEGGAWVWIAE